MVSGTYKAVVFDIGGVVGSPLEGIRDYERAHGIPDDYVNIVIVRYGQRGAFQRLERGELSLDEFYKAFEAELNDPANYALYEEYLASRGRPVPARPPRIAINAVELFGQMMAKVATPNAHMLEAIRRLRARGFVVAALTNNFQVADGSLPSTKETDIPALFDHFIESSVEGLRKPDPAFFELALRRLGLPASQCIFLDDLGINLKTAKQLGFTTIRVGLFKNDEALQALERLVGFELYARARL